MQRRRDARIGVAIPMVLRQELESLALAKNVNISVIVREAVSEYIRKNAPKNRKKS